MTQNRIYVARGLHTNRPQKASGNSECAAFLFLSHFDLRCDLNKPMTTWDVFRTKKKFTIDKIFFLYHIKRFNSKFCTAEIKKKLCFISHISAVYQQIGTTTVGPCKILILPKQFVRHLITIFTSPYRVIKGSFASFFK